MNKSALTNEVGYSQCIWRCALDTEGDQWWNLRIFVFHLHMLVYYWLELSYSILDFISYMAEQCSAAFDFKCYKFLIQDLSRHTRWSLGLPSRTISTKTVAISRTIYTLTDKGRYHIHIGGYIKSVVYSNT